jgi:hypothetical protein
VTYRKLIEYHKAGEVSFANVVTFKCVRATLLGTLGGAWTLAGAGALAGPDGAVARTGCWSSHGTLLTLLSLLRMDERASALHATRLPPAGCPSSVCSMDEYVGLPKEHEQSYHYFMWENFFKHVSAASLHHPVMPA